jgi:hypothetical protein
VGGVQVRVHVADGNGFDAVVDEFLSRLDDLLFVEWPDHITWWIDSFGDRLAVSPWDDRIGLLGLLEQDREGVFLPVATDVDDVAKAPRRQHTRLCALVFDKCVRCDRRAVEEGVDRFRIDPSLFTDCFDTLRARD